MKKKALLFSGLMLGSLLPAKQACAQFLIADIITAAVKKVIVAIDLEVQRLQTQTIYLQEAQRQVENLMSQNELTVITGWVQRQKDLYAEYYQELWEIKNVITYYRRVRDMIDKQGRLIDAYRNATALLGKDKHFSAQELAWIEHVYAGILNESARDIGQLRLVITAFTTQMSDADRLKIVDACAERIDKNYGSLQSFTQENILLSLQRTKDLDDLDEVRSLYGIP